jgi:hypothetical protein
MIRGTTAQFKFKLPYSKDDIVLAEAKFWQSGNTNGLNRGYSLPITKSYTRTVSDEGDIVTQYPWNWIDDYTLVVRLGQQETLTFSDKYKARVQLRIRTDEGLVFASTQQIINVYPMSWSEPLGADLPSTPEDQWVILDGDAISRGGES